jgi:spore photoproduct lyase
LTVAYFTGKINLILKVFDDIKLVIYDKNESGNRITTRVIKEAENRSKKILSFSSDEELGLIIDDSRKKYSSKEVLILKKFMGRKFQKCPGSPGVICCNYYLLNTCFNCLYDCTYCFLNSYLNSYGIVQFINLDELVPAIVDFTDKTDKIVRIGTGEFTDSLMFDEITGISRELIINTACIKNLFLEFKTKSANVDHILDIKDKGNAVLAWSLNTEKNISDYEAGASSLEERLEAAYKAQQSGYYIAFHFDPIIKYENYLDDYLKIVDRVFKKFNPEKLVWISLGCFRYSSGFKDIIKHQYPFEKLTVQEMFPGIDGKYRYLKQERTQVFKAMSNRIKLYSSRPFVYMCMEGEEMWQDIFNADYKTSDELEYAFSEHLRNNFFR